MAPTQTRSEQRPIPQQINHTEQMDEKLGRCLPSVSGGEVVNLMELRALPECDDVQALRDRCCAAQTSHGRRPPLERRSFLHQRHCLQLVLDISAKRSQINRKSISPKMLPFYKSFFDISGTWYTNLTENRRRKCGTLLQFCLRMMFFIYKQHLIP
ncbi:Protein of unknown function, partial [Gryllus bimaculatus]